MLKFLREVSIILIAVTALAWFFGKFEDTTPQYNHETNIQTMQDLVTLSVIFEQMFKDLEEQEKQKEASK